MTLDFALFFCDFPAVCDAENPRPLFLFLADMLSVLYAARYRDRRFMPLLVVSASLMSYMPLYHPPAPGRHADSGADDAGGAGRRLAGCAPQDAQNRAALAMKGGEAA